MKSHIVLSALLAACLALVPCAAADVDVAEEEDRVVCVTVMAFSYTVADITVSNDRDRDVCAQFVTL